VRTRLPFLGAFLVSCTSAPPASHLPPPVIPSREYAGVYVSTSDEEYFTPCGIDIGTDSWTESRIPSLDLLGNSFDDSPSALGLPEKKGLVDAGVGLVCAALGEGIVPNVTAAQKTTIATRIQ
jgi:hypothetical protein